MTFKVYLCIVVLSVCWSWGCSGQYIMRPVYVRESALVPRVVNGTPVVLGELPYQVGFKEKIGGRRRRFPKKTRYHTFCGGVIVRNDKVLSAAHCFTYSSPCCKKISRTSMTNKYAVAGNLYTTSSIYTEGQARSIRVVKYPANYSFPFHSDIAIVLLSSPFTFNDHVDKIPFARSYIDYKHKCLASGFGHISMKKQVQSERLLKAELEILPNYWCSRLYKRNMKDLVCTSNKHTDVARGDSGGPLVCRNTGHKSESHKYGILVGVTSGGSVAKGTFFTRISSFVKYIDKDRAQSNCNCSLRLYVTCSILVFVYYRTKTMFCL